MAYVGAASIFQLINYLLDKSSIISSAVRQSLHLSRPSDCMHNKKEDDKDIPENIFFLPVDVSKFLPVQL